MLHLAQVQKKGFLGKTGLRLLARQKSEDTWAVLAEPDLLIAPEANPFNEGVLVLLDLSTTRQVLKIQEATDWILSLVKNYLGNGLSVEFLQQEIQRAEQWRQSLTLQSQEISRRFVEIEARREQIQQLEEQLKWEKHHVESMMHALTIQTEELKRRSEEVEEKWQKVQELADKLQQESS